MLAKASALSAKYVSFVKLWSRALQFFWRHPKVSVQCYKHQVKFRRTGQLLSAQIKRIIWIIMGLSKYFGRSSIDMLRFPPITFGPETHWNRTATDPFVGNTTRGRSRGILDLKAMSNAFRKGLHVVANADKLLTTPSVSLCLSTTHHAPKPWEY